MRRVILAIVISSSLVGCSANMGHHNPTDIKKALNNAINESTSRPQFELPASVSADLMPALGNTSVSNKVLDKRFRINAKNVEASTFFTSLIKGTPFNIVIDPEVKGRITMKLKDVTLDNVLNVASDIYGYNITRKGNIIQVFPATLRTEVIPVNYLQLQRKGVSLTSITTGSTVDDNEGSSSGNNSSNNNDNNNNSNDNNNSNSNGETTGGTTIETTSKSDFWAQLEKVVSGMIGKGEGRNVMVSPQAGLISVRAYPNELREVKQFLKMSQTRLTRQVVLEAKIMEVTLDDSYQQGIDWNNLTSSLGGSVGAIVKGARGVVASIVNGQANITITDGNFQSVMHFLATQGDLNVLSSPRVTAANNQKAVIKVGGDEYFVTNISSSNVSGDNSSAAPDIKLTPFFSGISLDVTPQIDDNGGVLLHVHPVVVDVQNDVKSVNLGEKFGTYQLPLAKSTIRESDSIIHAQSGDVVVIGGLMKTSYSEKVSKVPLLGDIPVLGNLFRHTNRIKKKTELVILLKPTVVTDHTWQNEIERSRSLLNQWFPDEN